jgi:hypothetical protein
MVGYRILWSNHNINGVRKAIDKFLKRLGLEYWDKTFYTRCKMQKKSEFIFYGIIKNR